MHSPPHATKTNRPPPPPYPSPYRAPYSIQRTPASTGHQNPTIKGPKVVGWGAGRDRVMTTSAGEGARPRGRLACTAPGGCGRARRRSRDGAAGARRRGRARGSALSLGGPAPGEQAPAVGAARGSCAASERATARGPPNTLAAVCRRPLDNGKGGAVVNPDADRYRYRAQGTRASHRARALCLLAHCTAGAGAGFDAQAEQLRQTRDACGGHVSA